MTGRVNIVIFFVDKPKGGGGSNKVNMVFCVKFWPFSMLF